MHTLHLTYIDPNRLIAAIKGLRAARSAVGNSFGAPLKACKESVDEFKAGQPVLVGEHEDLVTVREAARLLKVESSGAALGEVGLTAAEACEAAHDWREAQSTPPQDEDSEHVSIGYDACKTALVLMCMTGGNPAYVIAASKSLAMATGDEELYSEVISFLEDTFPPSE